MQTAELIGLAIKKFKRIPRIAIPDLVYTDELTGQYCVEYPDKSVLYFSNRQLGEGIASLEALDYLPIRACNPKTLETWPAFVYRGAILGFVQGTICHGMFLRTGLAISVLSNIETVHVRAN